MACVYMDCNVQSGHIFIVTVDLINFMAKAAINHDHRTQDSLIKRINGSTERRGRRGTGDRGADAVRLRRQKQTRRTASDREERGKKAMEEGRGTDKRDGVNRKAGRNEEKLQSALGRERRWSI